jgi:hypothetical protein
VVRDICCRLDIAVADYDDERFLFIHSFFFLLLLCCDIFGVDLFDVLPEVLLFI